MKLTALIGEIRRETNNRPACPAVETLPDKFAPAVMNLLTRTTQIIVSSPLQLVPLTLLLFDIFNLPLQRGKEAVTESS